MLPIPGGVLNNSLPASVLPFRPESTTGAAASGLRIRGQKPCRPPVCARKLGFCFPLRFCNVILSKVDVSEASGHAVEGSLAAWRSSNVDGRVALDKNEGGVKDKVILSVFLTPLLGQRG